MLKFAEWIKEAKNWNRTNKIAKEPISDRYMELIINTFANNPSLSDEEIAKIVSPKNWQLAYLKVAETLLSYRQPNKNTIIGAKYRSNFL